MTTLTETTFKNWQDRVSTAVIFRTEDAEAHKAIVWMCVEAELAGGGCGTWHASAVYFGRPCNCVPCCARRTNPSEAVFA
jgi:hypothetical protein